MSEEEEEMYVGYIFIQGVCLKALGQISYQQYQLSTLVHIRIPTRQN